MSSMTEDIKQMRDYIECLRSVIKKYDTDLEELEKKYASYSNTDPRYRTIRLDVLKVRADVSTFYAEGLDSLYTKEGRGGDNV